MNAADSILLDLMGKASAKAKRKLELDSESDRTVARCYLSTAETKVFDTAWSVRQMNKARQESKIASKGRGLFHD